MGPTRVLIMDPCPFGLQVMLGGAQMIVTLSPVSSKENQPMEKRKKHLRSHIAQLQGEPLFVEAFIKGSSTPIRAVFLYCLPPHLSCGSQSLQMYPVCRIATRLPSFTAAGTCSSRRSCSVMFVPVLGHDSNSGGSQRLDVSELLLMIQILHDPMYTVPLKFLGCWNIRSCRIFLSSTICFGFCVSEWLQA